MIENIQSLMNRITEIRRKFVTASKSSDLTSEKKSEQKSSSFDQLLQKSMSETETEKKDAGEKETLDQKISRYAQKHKVDPELVKALINVESGFDPQAVSKKGAMGLMQLMPETADSLGVSNPFNVDDNLDGGVSLLSDLLKKYSGDIDLALAAYNAGPGQVKKYSGVPPFPETQNYIRKIRSIYLK